MWGFFVCFVFHNLVKHLFFTCQLVLNWLSTCSQYQNRPSAPLPNCSGELGPGGGRDARDTWGHASGTVPAWSRSSVDGWSQESKGDGAGRQNRTGAKLDDVYRTKQTKKAKPSYGRFLLKWERKSDRGERLEGEQHRMSGGFLFSFLELKWQYFTSVTVKFILLKLFFRGKQRREKKQKNKNVFIDLKEVQLEKVYSTPTLCFQR